MASTSASRRTASTPAEQTVLPDEIWEDILLRLDAAADLARASAACSTLRRVVSEPRFLRRFRSLHSPPVLGFINGDGFEYQGFLPVEPPHRSAPEARALVQAADFTFSFLPDHGTWRFCHARDGRVLLSRRVNSNLTSVTCVEDFVVCDPLHRRYVKIPHIPDDLMAGCCRPPVSPVLAPAGDNDEEETFRIICIDHFRRRKGMVMVFIFSYGNQTWQAIVSTTETACVPNGYIAHKPSYAYGCFYWMVGSKGYALMLDTSQMKFSIIDLPPHNFDSKRAIVEAADGRLGFLTIGDGTANLHCKNRQSNGDGAQEWQHDKLIPLPKDSWINYNWNIEGTTGSYVAFSACINWYDMHDNEYFLLDIKTLLVEKLCTWNNNAIYGFPYARFPPPLALPSI